MKRFFFALVAASAAVMAAALPQLEDSAPLPTESVAPEPAVLSAAVDTGPPPAWRRVELDGLSVETLTGLSPSPLSELPVYLASASNALFYRAGAGEADEVDAFIRRVDAAPVVEPLRLSYLDAEHVLSSLPPGTRSGTVTRSAEPRTLYLTGSSGERERLRSAIATVDQPPVQIRYQILVVQRQSSDALSWSVAAENGLAAPGSRTRLLAGVGNLLALNFDILSVFGYQFAVDLNAELSLNQARVLADTSLTGLRGERVSLENTDTYRYRDLEIDPATGEAAPTGTTREITSGLVIHIQGEPVGSDQVDLAVEVRVSKRGSDPGGGTNNPPPTSEKIVQTVVRARSGEPAVIGALAQSDRGSSIKGVPLLARIPLVGALFQHRRDNAEEVSLAVYIVPFRSDTVRKPNRPTASQIISRYLPVEVDR